MSSPGHRPEDVHSERLQGPLSGKQLKWVRTPALGDAIPRTGIAPSYGLVDIRRHSRPKEGPSSRQEHFVSSRVSGGDRVVLIVEDTPDQPGRHHNLASPVTWSNPDQQYLFVEIVNPLCGLDGQKSAAGVISSGVRAPSFSSFPPGMCDSESEVHSVARASPQWEVVTA